MPRNLCDNGHDLNFSAYKSALTVNLQPSTPTVTGTKGFRNISTLVGGAAMDKIIAANLSNTWNITSASAGTIGALAFSSFENLTGGSLDDTFLFAAGQSVKGKIDGGLGSDTLDYSSFTSAVTVNLQTKTTTNTAGYLGIEIFRGGSGMDTFIAANRANQWNVAGPGTGSVSGNAFANFDNLTGGLLTDLFNVATAGSWNGTLDGGTGADILTALAGSNYVITAPNTGTLNSFNFKNIETRR